MQVAFGFFNFSEYYFETFYGTVGIAADGSQSKPSGNNATTYQEDHLQDIGPGYRFQTAVNGIKTGKQQQADYSIHLGYAQNLIHSQRSQPSYGGQVDKDVNQEPKEGEKEGNSFSVTFTGQLRYGENFPVQHDGQ